MANLATQVITLEGVGPTYAAAAGGGDTFTPGDDVFLHVKNGGGAPITVTVVTPNTVGTLAIADVTVSVPAAGERMIGPMPRQTFSRSADGLGDITYSAVTSVTVAVLDARR